MNRCYLWDPHHLEGFNTIANMFYQRYTRTCSHVMFADQTGPPIVLGTRSSVAITNCRSGGKSSWKTFSGARNARCSVGPVTHVDRCTRPRTHNLAKAEEEIGEAQAKQVLRRLPDDLQSCYSGVPKHL